MELHHSPVHHEKKWKDYLFEFLMLFLAVSAGFFVENLREHYVEVDREKQFIHSMISDINGDIHQIDSSLAMRRSRANMIDSMLWILDTPDPDQYGGQLYYYARNLPRMNRIYNYDGTITQLKNAGNLRLIRSSESKESIMEYDQQMRFWSNVEDREEMLVEQYYPALKTMFDSRVFEEMVDGLVIKRPTGNPHLLIKDRPHINELYSHVHFLKNVNSYQMAMGEKRLELAKHTLSVLKSEYDVK